MATYTTGDTGEWHDPAQTSPATPPEPADPLEELDAAVRALLHEIARLQIDDDAFDTAYDELQHDLTRLQDEWKRLQSRVQQIFTMIALVRRALARV